MPETEQQVPHVLSQRPCAKCSASTWMLVKAPELASLDGPTRDRFVATLLAVTPCPACGEDSMRKKHLTLARRLHWAKLVAPAAMLYAICWLLGTRTSPMIGFGNGLGENFIGWVLTVGVLVIGALITWGRWRSTPFDPNPFGIRAIVAVAPSDAVQEILAKRAARA